MKRRRMVIAAVVIAIFWVKCCEDNIMYVTENPIRLLLYEQAYRILWHEQPQRGRSEVVF